MATPQPTDDEILAQLAAIREEECASLPLISSPISVVDFTEKIRSSGAPTSFIVKLESLPKESKIRRIRPDGNCFYRAYACGILQIIKDHGQQTLPDNTTLSARFRTLVSKEGLQCCEAAGYPKFTVEDFMEAFLEEIDKLDDTGTTAAGEISSDNDAYIVTFLRCLSSSVLKLHREEYAPFLSPEYPTIDQYCATEVDPMYREADQLPIVALSRFLQFPVEIVYIDQSPETTPAKHTFPPTNPLNLPTVRLLYRPGHYDLLV
ncbi:Ubiquitin thioesterase protein OTUB1, putative [Perkinsus marinus ATCC 50983]|uniref:ubiquitinyl hydrolase 1 n=1 Tax=Perkinsus marinus (strain ATCC 50983 / TXsc) TaxID=423536 RepID=C5K7I3_PERM5|nr:Ubiquitin thioesterase protein OTUB1, putative [Perkinsus marinus ATCC 50983]EER19517.1 Ubiquitin thioesterase protein OTUB1, putative [Perkinsus marinus ATCC 50983]|eukprot:XP_002787721.1 Ubiquitin thioesterase protein OTUB1, putative [Perkinsus marinus ATCC 50983]